MLTEGTDVTIGGNRDTWYGKLWFSEKLEKQGISAEVINHNIEQ